MRCRWATPSMSRAFRKRSSCSAIQTENLVVNLLGVELDERPRYFAKLFPQLCQLRDEIARPHWVLIDEAHHMMPPEWAGAALPQQPQGTILATVHPEHVARAALETVAFVVAVGSDPAATLRSFLRRPSGGPA